VTTFCIFQIVLGYCIYEFFTHSRKVGSTVYLKLEFL
jgi:hypothetical protein